MKRQFTYVAVTSTNPGNGFQIIAAGHSKSAVETKAQDIIGTGDIYAETEQKNLYVVSKTSAKKNFGVNFDDFNAPLSNRYEWVK